jgi:hypothetical protein
MTTIDADLQSVTEADLLLARRELALEKRLVELQQTNALHYFRPHPKQELFFAAAGFHYRYARTGNRFGKSEMGAAEDVSFALGFRPWLAKEDPGRTKGIPPFPVKGLIITTDWDKSTDVFTCEEEGTNKGKLFRYIPKDCLLGYSRNHSGAIDTIRVKHVSGGVSILHLDTVKSFKQNPAGQESSSWDFIHVDEPIPEKMWKAVSRGLVDRGGRAWFTCTPISEPWIDQKFIPNPEDQVKANLGTIASLETSSWMMTGEMDDNPHLTAEAIERFMQDLSDDEKDARRKGIPLAYSGIIYKEFDMNVHVLRDVPVGWSSWAEPPADHTIRVAHDYHFKKNDAVLFIATSPQEFSYIFAELWIPGTVKEIANATKNVLSGFKGSDAPLRDYQPIRMDPLASIEMKSTDLTVMDEYRMQGLAVLPATKDPVNGIRAVKALLKNRDKLGRPTLLFNPDCKRTIYEISRGFQWKPDANEPVKKDDDMMENLGRLAREGLSYIEPSTDADWSSFRPSTDFEDFENITPFPGLDDESEPKKTPAFNHSRYRA